MRWLVVGADGQLGTDLCEVLAAAGHLVVGVDYPSIDITDAPATTAAAADAGADVVVNAAAYTAVDAAEDDEDAALAVNCAGAANLAAAVALLPRSRLIHISTDYVFPGDAAAPYSEDAPVGPRSAYGRTKAAGEAAVRSLLPDRGYVVRTAWLYGEHGRNFVTTMLQLERQRDTVAVVDDQVGQPTWTGDLARQLLALGASSAPAGIYHGTNSGSCSWYTFAREVFRLAGADPRRVTPTTTDAFPRPAPRPAYSVLGHDAWTRAALPPMRAWQDAAAEGIPRIIARMAGPMDSPPTFR
jgi:dTDP-4-dehydrorhamnose reductase